MKTGKFKVNILDFLILALIAIVIAGAFLRVNVKQNDERLATQAATVSFKISNVQEASVQYFRPGTQLYSETLGCDLGKLAGDVTYAPATFYVERGGKIIKTASASGRVDIYGTISCDGQMSESGFLLGGTQYIAPGISTFVRLPEICATILITDITVH